MSIEMASSILYTYAKERRGQNSLIEALIARVESEENSLLPGELLAQIVVSLNLVGRTNSPAFKKFRSQANLKKTEMSQYEEAMLNTVENRL